MGDVERLADILVALDAEDDYVRSWKLARQIRQALPAHDAEVAADARREAWGEGWNARARGEFYDTNPYRAAASHTPEGGR